MTASGGFCPNCDEAGVLHIDEHYVRCDNYDYERYSTQQELDIFINDESLRKNPLAERLVTLIEPEPFIEERTGRPIGLKDFEIKR